MSVSTAFDDKPLLTEHTRLDRLTLEVLDAVKDGRRDRVEDRWALLRPAILRHLQEEEFAILPVYAEVDAGDAATIVADHRRIRGMIRDVDMGIDRGTWSGAEVIAAVHFFRMHHAHEEVGMYRWAASRKHRP